MSKKNLFRIVLLVVIILVAGLAGLLTKYVPLPS